MGGGDFERDVARWAGRRHFDARGHELESVLRLEVASENEINYSEVTVEPPYFRVAGEAICVCGESIHFYEDRSPADFALVLREIVTQEWPHPKTRRQKQCGL